jgi:hypothetical protein
MAFSRPAVQASPLSPEILTARLVGIGFNIAASGDPDADLEDTLVQGSVAGLEGQDLRVLSLLTTWLGIHHTYLNIDRLARLIKAQSSERVRAYWAAISQWLAKDRRIARLAALHRGPVIDLLEVGTEFQLARRGEDPRFVGTPLRVPAGTLRDRPGDVLSPAELVHHHAGYRNRLRFGPTWRADIWTLLQASPTLSVAETARRAGCAFGTAWQVVRDFRLLQGEVAMDQGR